MFRDHHHHREDGDDEDGQDQDEEDEEDVECGLFEAHSVDDNFEDEDSQDEKKLSEYEENGTYGGPNWYKQTVKCPVRQSVTQKPARKLR